MIPRIKNVEPQKDFKLCVSFDDGKTVIYDVKEDIDQISAFEDLRTQCGLFENVQLNESRTCLFWNDYIDLPSDTIYEYGKKTDPHC